MENTISRVYAGVVGTVVVAIGVLGFISYFTPDQMLFGAFSVNAIHNGIHLSTGMLGIICAFAYRGRYAALYTVMMGFLYSAVAVLGFTLNGDFFELAYFNFSDNLLHTIIGLQAMLACIVILLTDPEQILMLFRTTPQDQY